jgi:hypothetical protein
MNISLFLLLILLLSIIIFYFICSVLIKNTTLSKKNKQLKELTDINSELRKYNTSLIDLVNKQKYLINALENDAPNYVKSKAKLKEQFNLDDILLEISKVGLKNLSKDKLEFLKKFNSK